ncbi:MAG TPA: 30S ribosomal protein S20 [Candidatus Paceibacterota bacterium]|jgi:small subunit ribosomal protein S20|nr:30S ribosomal protein S20 [Candidatus Paceibacterota bacterium]HRS47881.1 30S ribosomal protein S20 [Candidatus Paceibacterota bacterium]
MPKIKSAKKALRQSLKRQKRNLKKKNDIRISKKNYLKAVETGNDQEALQKLSQVYKALDKAQKTKVIKKNKANRLKSKLSKKLPISKK